MRAACGDIPADLAGKHHDPHLSTVSLGKPWMRQAVSNIINRATFLREVAE
jgi:hypothetical protein